MNIVIFGLTISSSWGNGHATLWRGLCSALARQGHRVTFYERDVPYYAASRDWREVPGGSLVIYADWPSVELRARRDIAGADVAIVTSYCTDGAAAAHLVFNDGHPLSVFYDLDTPITLAKLRRGERPAYVPPEGLGDFDLVLSFTGGDALRELRTRLGARNVRPLYGHVDPAVHRPASPVPDYRAALSYLGTYAADRQASLEALFVEPAGSRPGLRFLIGGAQYPDDFPWSANVHFVHHVTPERHSAFFSSARLTLNVTREAMAAMGWCPSGRLFEAAACSAAILTDGWEGLDTFYRPNEEILVAGNTQEALAAIDMDDAQLQRIGRAARERTLAEHTSERRTIELLDALDGVSHTPHRAAL